MNNKMTISEAISVLTELSKSKLCSEELKSACGTITETLNKSNNELKSWEEIKEKEVALIKCPGASLYHTTETCPYCKENIGFIGAKRYIKDNYCPNCGTLIKK